MQSVSARHEADQKLALMSVKVTCDKSAWTKASDRANTAKPRWWAQSAGCFRPFTSAGNFTLGRPAFAPVWNVTAGRFRACGNHDDFLADKGFSRPVSLRTAAVGDNYYAAYMMFRCKPFNTESQMKSHRRAQ